MNNQSLAAAKEELFRLALKYARALEQQKQEMLTEPVATRFFRNQLLHWAQICLQRAQKESQHAQPK